MISDLILQEIDKLPFRKNYPYDKKLIIDLLKTLDDAVSENEKNVSAGLYNGLKGALVNAMSNEKENPFNKGLYNGINLLRHNLYEDPNPVISEVKIPFDKFNKYQDGSAVHLELGTFTAWPDDQADRYIKVKCLGDVIRLDMEPKFGPDIAASVTALPFADESIDRISSNSLMEHCPYPHDILKEAFRVLRPGGSILTIVPFNFVEHGCPKDYLRFTGQFFEDVCADIGFSEVYVDTSATSGIYYITHLMLKAGIVNEGAPMGNSLAKVHTALMTLLAMLQGFDKSFHAHGASLWHTTFALAIKPGEYVRRNDKFDRSLPFYKRFADYIVCPNTGLPVREVDDFLVSVDGSNKYPIINKIPNMFCLHGFGSSLRNRASSREALRLWKNESPPKQ